MYLLSLCSVCATGWREREWGGWVLVRVWGRRVERERWEVTT